MRLLALIAILVATSAQADPDCPDVVSGQYHVDRTQKMCVGCETSPWATEESIAEERKQAAAFLERAQAACASIKEQAIKNRAAAKALQVKVDACAKRNKIEAGEVRLGMTAADALLCGWGEPRKVNRTINARFTHEQWVYREGYLYFENGRLTTIQD